MTLKLLEHCVLDRLAEDLSSTETPNRFWLGLPDRWIATSLLQKAIRRGETNNALRAASYLLHAEPEYFWRRFPVIAWEDISFGDPDLCAAVTSASGSKRWRRNVGGDWKVASHLTVQMSQAIKDRCTDDLAMVLVHDPRFSKDRYNFSKADDGFLANVLRSDETSLEKRALALWMLAGTSRRGFDDLPSRQGHPEIALENMQDLMSDSLFTQFARLGVTRTRTILPILGLNLAAYSYQELRPAEIQSKPLPTRLIDTIPDYAFDGFTRAGRRYLKSIAREDPRLARCLEHVSPGLRDKLVRELHFRLRSSHCDRRHKWTTSLDLMKRADQCAFSLNTDYVIECRNHLDVALNNHPFTEAYL